MTLDSRPPRASLLNLATDQQMDFLFNPQTFEERLEAKYDKVGIVGLSHERLQYKNTSNNIIPIELYISQLLQDKLSGEANSSPTLIEQKAWLQSLVYPVESEDFGYIGPPRVLFIWPEMLRLIGRITNITFIHRDFSNVTLKTIRLTARLTFEEDLEFRRLMDEVQLSGSLVAEVV